MVEIDRLEDTEHDVYRRIRLSALAESPSAFASTLDAEESLAEEHWQSITLDRSRSEESAVFLARVNGDVIGLAGVYRPHREQPMAELVQMWVEPSARGMGVGRALVAKAIEWATDAGFARIELWVVRDNASAAGLYRSMGFEDTGDITPLPSDPCRQELRMRRAL